MVPYRGLFLVVIISLASIVLADVLVQPGYKYQYGNNPQYQSVPQYRNPSLASQYYAQQLPNQESARNFVQAQMSYSDKARSNGARIPYLFHLFPHMPHQNLHYLPRPSSPHHYVKLGGYGYTRPSVFVGHPQPLTVHWRSRSVRSVPTSIDSSKSAIVAHDNDVAAKSPLTNDKHPTAIDSLLPENEPTDTNDKRVENRQSRNDHVTRPFLFGLYPEKMYPEPSEAQTFEYIKSVSIPAGLSKTFQKEASFTDSRILTNRPSIIPSIILPPLDDEEEEKTLPSQEKERPVELTYYSKYRDAPKQSADSQLHILTNRPSIRLPPDDKEEEKRPPPQEKEGPVELTYYSKYRDAAKQSVDSQLAHMMQNTAGWHYGMYFPQQKRLHYDPDILDGNLWAAHEENGKTYIQKIEKYMPYMPSKGKHNTFTLKIPYSKESPTTNNALVTPTYVQPQYRNNEELFARTNDMDDTPYFNRFGMQYPEYVSFYIGNYPDFYSNYNLNDDSNERQYSNENVYIDLLKRNSAHHITPSINQIPHYVLYKNVSAENNLTPMVSRRQTQFLDTYNYSPENNLQAIPPKDYRYHSINPSDTPSYDTSSSSVYY